jgi:hypothetical protein
MRRVLKRIGFGLLIAGLALVLVATNVQAKYRVETPVLKAFVLDPPQPGGGKWSTAAEELPTYTLEELQNAEDMPLRQVVPGQGPAAALDDSVPGSQPGPPMVGQGWNPQSGLPQPDPSKPVAVEFAPISLPSSLGAAPSNPRDGPYAPFQRWTWYGSYATQSTQMIGKLFIDTNNDGIRDKKCSASVIGSRTIATSGSCVADSLGTYYSHFLFCPGYYKGAGSGAPQPGYGCWGYTFVEASANFLGDTSNVDRDYACILTAPVGDTYAGKVGVKTGWATWAVNYADTLEFAWGYPGGSPFPAAGYHIIADVSPDWYQVDMNSLGVPYTKFIGSDVTAGATGGPWYMSVSHRTAEYNDIDDSAYTDPPGSFGLPGGPYLDGLYSSRRCTGTCTTYPPDATNGPFWQEAGSPQFLSDGPGVDTDQVLDIFNSCWSQE